MEDKIIKAIADTDEYLDERIDELRFNIEEGERLLTIIKDACMITAYAETIRSLLTLLYRSDSPEVADYDVTRTRVLNLIDIVVMAYMAVEEPDEK